MTQLHAAEIDWGQLQPYQEEFVDLALSRRHRLLMWVGAIRSGKGVGAAKALIHRAVCDAGLRAAITSISSPARRPVLFRSNNEAYLMGAAEALGLRLVIKGGTQPGYDLGPGLARFYLYGGDNARSYSRLRGLTVDGGWIDEATLCEESFVRTAVQRCTFEGSQLILTTNTDTPDHWLNEWIQDETIGPQVCVRQSTFLDNQKYAEASRQFILSMNPNSADYRRAVLNEWAGNEGLVFPLPDSFWNEEDYGGPVEVFIDPGRP